MLAEIVLTNGALAAIVPATLISVIGFFTWLVRQISTLSSNNKEMATLLAALKDDVKDIREIHRSDIKELHQKQDALTALIYGRPPGV